MVETELVADSPELALPAPIRIAIRAIEDRKGFQVTVLDLRTVTDTTDFFVIATGSSDTHVRGIGDAVVESFDEAGLHPHHVEGMSGGRWVLIDCLDVVVHLFHPEARAFYQLERLWGDAPVLVKAPEGGEKGQPA